YRSSFNDPQIQLAEDAARALSSGAPVELPVTNPVDIARSLAVFHVFYDDAGRPLSGTARLNGTLPNLPAGVFDYVRANHETRISWQPQPGVRSAIVVTRVTGTRSGFIMVGRSMRELELRIRNLIFYLFVGMGGALLGSLILMIFGAWVSKERTTSPGR